MNYLAKAIYDLKLEGVYYTPEKIEKMIITERNNVIIGNPPIKSKKYDVISPDGFSINLEGYYNSLNEAKFELINYIKKYKAQGYYSTVINGERIRIPFNELTNYFEIVEI